jgi:hypothetical protein
VRAIVRTWSKLRLDWEVGRHRLPFFTQKVAVVLLGVLVATRPPATAAPTATTGRGVLPPVEDVVSSVVSTLLP